MTAVELLAAFSGADAIRYESCFEYLPNGRIVAVEIYAVGNETTTARYSGRSGVQKEVNNILRVTTADGYEGVSGVDTFYAEFSDAQLQELRCIVPDLLALQTLDPVEVGNLLERTHPDLSDEARSGVDIALWDLGARKAGCSLYELLGARRDSLTAYASLPYFDSLNEYVQAVERCAGLGYETFKFHVWGHLEKDLQLVRTVQQTFARSPYRFMVDVEGAYGFDEALALGRAMDERLFVWLEAPLDDALLDQYAALRRRLPLSIIPAGYRLYSPDFIRQGVLQGAWDAGRFDATEVGGISRALELMTIAEAADLPIEVQSWGHSLAQAANLHLMLANERTRYFESPMPGEAFAFGMKNGIAIEAGMACVPAGPGLGIEVDWAALAAADFYRCYQ